MCVLLSYVYNEKFMTPFKFLARNSFTLVIHDARLCTCDVFFSQRFEQEWPVWINIPLFQLSGAPMAGNYNGDHYFCSSWNFQKEIKKADQSKTLKHFSLTKRVELQISGQI